MQMKLVYTIGRRHLGECHRAAVRLLGLFNVAAGNA